MECIYLPNTICLIKTFLHTYPLAIKHTHEISNNYISMYIYIIIMCIYIYSHMCPIYSPPPQKKIHKTSGPPVALASFTASRRS